MDSRHPGVQDASGDVHVGLDSSTPCWNDGIESPTKTDRGTPPCLFSKETLNSFGGGIFFFQDSRKSQVPSLPKPEEGPSQLFQDGFSQLGTGLGNLGKVLHPFIGPAGVDHGAGIHQRLCSRRDHRIEGA